MEVKSSNSTNIYFFSTHHAGITSILNRIMYNKFEDNCTTEKKSYQYKIFSGENFVTINFHEQNLEILNDLDIKADNIIILVYDLNINKSSDSLNPINEYIKSIVGDNLKSIKIGIIGNKLDLISQNDKESLKEMGEKYAQKINAKFLMTSAKKGLDDIFQFILSIINSKSKNEIFVKNNKIILKEYQQLFKSKNLNGVIRCEKCKTKIAKIIFHDKSEKIELCCNEHNDEKFIYIYKDIINLINKKCNICQKEFDEKSNDSLMYCKLCKVLICNKCIKRHEHGQNSNENLISYYNEEDLLCFIHGIKNDLYCINCNSLICSFCYNNEHKEHKIKKFENNIIDNLIREKRNQLNNQKKQLENLKKYYTNLINEITKLYNEFKEKMDLVLNLKENVLNQLEIIKYNNELYTTVVNMKFNEIKVDLDDNSNKSILDKLTVFFDCIEQPIRIVKYNICNGSKVLKKYNLRQNDKINIIKNKPKLTDACNIDCNLCCFGFDDGNIYIFNKKDFKTCLKHHQLYDMNRGVNSIINYKNDNLIFTSGFEKIYQLKINKNLYIQKEALITRPDTNFIKLCDYNYRKSIVYTDDAGNIGIYNIFDKQEFKIKDDNDNENLEINSIIDFYNINENAFFMKYLSYELQLKSEKVSVVYPSNNRQNSEIILERYSIMDVATSDTSVEDKEKSRELSKIFYIDEQNKIYNEHTFSETTKILGIINKEYIVIEETNEKEQIKYKILNLVTKKELYFGELLSGIKKDWNFKLIGENPDDGKIYFVLVDYDFNLLEFSYYLQSNKIEEIGLLRRVNKDNPKDPKHKIIKILLMKNNFIIVKNNGELYVMNY